MADSRKILGINKSLQSIQEQISASNNKPTDDQTQQMLDVSKEMLQRNGPCPFAIGCQL